MAAINSTNKTLTGNSQNCDVTLSGQPNDKNLSVKVSTAHTVNVDPNSDLVTLVSNSQSSVLKDTNNMPYRTNSIQYAWKENKNTQGSIDGTISIKPSRTASSSGEFFKEGLYDGALPLTISGLNLVPTSDTRSEREVNATITCKVPVNISTNDLHGGTYTFTSDMSGKQGFDANVRGMFQTYFNEEEPFGTLQIMGNDNILGCAIQYDGDGWKDGDYLTKITPCIGVKPNLPSMKYGDVGGTLSIAQGPTSVSATPSEYTYNFVSTSKFWTTPSDKSNVHVGARDITCNYSFSRWNSKNTNMDKGTFTVHQEGGDIEPLDPEITYTWNCVLEPHENPGDYFTQQLVTRTVTATKNDGKTQTFSYTTGIILKPTTRMDGKKPKLNGTITLGDLSNSTNPFGTSQIDFSNGVQVSDRKYTITCGVNTNYITNDSITPRSTELIWTCPGAKWTVNPSFTVNLKVSYRDGNGVLHDEGPQIPGTKRNASVQLSKNGSNYSNSIDYTFTSGTWSPLNKTINLSRYKTYVSMSDNTPADSDGTGGNSGTLKSSVSIKVNGSDKTLSNLPSSKCNGIIKIVPSGLKFNPSKTSSFPELTWVIQASITSKTEHCTGTLTIDEASKTRTIIQPAVGAQESTYKDAKATITIPSWCTWTESQGDDSLTWTHEDTSSTKYTYFTVDENPITDFSWKIRVTGMSDITKWKITYNPSQSARSANITVTMPTGITTDTGASSFTQNIYQNLGSITGKIKVESVKGYTGIYTGQLIDWDKTFTWGTPSPNNPKVNYTVSIDITDGVLESSKISSDGATISGTITTGGSASPGDKIDLYAKFVLTGTNNDNAKYEGTDDEGFKEFSGTINGATTTLTEDDYDIRCYDGSGTVIPVTIDKENKTFSIVVGANSSTSATISKVEWSNPSASDHNNDLLSNPFKVTATKGKAVSARTIYIDTKAPGKDWVNAKTLTQQVGTASVNSATQSFTVDICDNCQVTVSPMTVSIPSGKDEGSSTGPSVDILTGNSSDGCLRQSTLPSGAPFNATISVDDKHEYVSFFEIKDISIETPVYYGGAFHGNGTTAECGFGFWYRACVHPDGHNLYSYYGDPNGILCDLGRVTGCKAEYSINNKNWTNFTGSNSSHATVTFKSSEISTRYSEDHDYHKTVYGRIVDSNGNVLTTATGTITLTVYGVKYYNS